MKLLSVKVAKEGGGGQHGYNSEVEILQVVTKDIASIIESHLARVVRRRKDGADLDQQPPPVLDVVRKHKARQLDAKVAVADQNSQEGQLSEELSQTEGQHQYKSILKKGSRATSINRPSINPRLDIGHLLKALFNIREESAPTSFVVLPYRLRLEDSDVVGH
eukprot:15037844-Ditylum_brightwellii.AAC.1